MLCLEFSCRPTLKPEIPVGERVCDLPTRKYEEIFLPKEIPLPGVCFFYDLEEGLNYSQSWNVPAFLYFTGHTSSSLPPWVEKEIENKSRVGNYLADEFVIIALYAYDSTPLDKPEMVNGKEVKTLGARNFQIEKQLYHVIAQPWYAIVDYDLRNMTQPRGYNPYAAAFLDFLQEGKRVFDKLHPGEVHSKHL